MEFVESGSSCGRVECSHSCKVPIAFHSHVHFRGPLNPVLHCVREEVRHADSVMQPFRKCGLVEGEPCLFIRNPTFHNEPIELPIELEDRHFVLESECLEAFAGNDCHVEGSKDGSKLFLELVPFFS